jgi:hypothetical protein
MKFGKNLLSFFTVEKSRPGFQLLFLMAVLATTLLSIPTCVPFVQPPAAPVVDQSFNALEASRGTPWENTGAGIGLGIHSEAAQTFTVGRSGVLIAVAVQIFRGTNSSQDVNFEIRRTVNLIPSEKKSDVLARKTISIRDIPYALPNFVTVDLTRLCLNLHQGEVLAIVLENQDMQSGCGWQTAPGNRYAGGERFAKSGEAQTWVSQGMGLSGQDLGFTTFVDPNYSCQPR